MCRIKSKELLKMTLTTLKAGVLGLLCALSAQIASAQNLCIQCPFDAQGPAVGGAFDVYLNAGGGVRGRRVTGDIIGRCQTNLLLVAQVSYNQFATGGGVGAGFTGGDYRWTLIARGAASVFEAVPGEPTPADMAMTLVTDITKPCASPVPAGFTTVGQKEMIDIPYTVTAADAASGFLQWLFDASTRPSALLTNLLGNCVETVSPAGTPSVLIAPPTTCSVTPDQRVCVGSPASFTASGAPLANDRFTFAWRKGCPGAGAVLSTNSTLSFASAQASDAGCYEVTVTDRFGCTTTCQATLTVVQAPRCVISPSSATNLPGTVQTLTITVTPGAGQNAGDLRTSVTCSPGGATAGPFTGVGPHTFNVTTPAVGQCITCTATVTDVSLPGSACTSTCEARVCGAGQACIQVYKQVVCYAPTGCEPFSADLNSQKSARGVTTGSNPAQCPAFCYRITIFNNSDVGVNLTQLQVSDSVLNLSACGFPTTLPYEDGVLGGADTVSCIVTGVTHCADRQNIVTATAVGISGTTPRPGCGEAGAGPNTVIDRDTNSVIIQPLAITCILDVSTNAGASFFTPGASCPQVILGNSYIVRVRTRNDGQHPLQNVTVTTTGAPLCFATPLNLGGMAVGETQTNQCTFTCNELSTNRYSVAVSGEAAQSPDRVCDVNSQGERLVARSTCEACVICAGTPGLEVRKQVVCYANGGCEPFSPNLDTQKSAIGVRLNPPNATNCPAFCYRITVRNTGTLALTLTVTDNSTPDPDLNLINCGFPTTLAVGATAQCVIPAVTHCQDTLNVVTATGSSQGGNVTVRDTNRVTIEPISIICILDVSTNGGTSFLTPSKSCPRVLVGNSYIVRVRTRNTGQHPLANVTVTTTGLPFECFGSPLNIGGLAMGETKTNQCTFVCNEPSTNRYSVSVAGEAAQSPDHVCDFNAQGQQLVARSSCAACVECVGPPDIEVIKEVACVLPGDNCGTFGKIATGVRDSACPAFCYRITVTNAGRVPIVTLTVTDPALGTNISALFGPLPLAPGDTRTAIIKPITHCVGITNTVRVVGRSADGQTDVDQDSAEVRVLNIHIVCTITLSSTNDLDGNPNNAHVLLPGSGLVEFTLTLNNTGSSALNVVSLNGLPALVDCATGAPVVPVLPINIGPGGSVTISACTAVTCPAGANYSVTARAEADDQNGTLCVYNRFGNRVTDETSCTALVECRPQAGCTPGFWKNCTIHWQPTGYTRGQSVNSVFSLGNCCGSLGGVSLASALEFGGGSDVCGGARILLRAAVAALLNASSPEVDYPMTVTEVINRVNGALHSCNRARIISLAGELDRNNNLGCRGMDNNGLPCHRLTVP